VILAKCFLCLAVVGCAGARTSEAAGSPFDFDRNFDEYGLIRWGDEQARLDNFAIQLQNEPDSIGYIFVYDGGNVCEGEAKTRAIRARKYVVEYRHVPWNRVMWRYEGYLENFMIALQPADRTIHFEYPFRHPAKDIPVRHIDKQCAARIQRIENSRPGQL
jgi:hypothetical protein